MTRRILTAVCLLLLATPSHSARAQSAIASAEAGGSDTVHVVPPTGARDADRASILAAFEQLQPGGTLQFVPGMYLVGELISISTPGITLLGRPDGTTLRGCEAGDYAAVGRGMVATWLGEADHDETNSSTYGCGLFELAGGHATVRGLTFEHAWSGLIPGCCEAALESRPTDGGYVIDDNTFRTIMNGVRAILWAPEPTVIRGNRFVDTFHAVSAFGSRLHLLNNQVSVPDPARISAIGHPGFAIALAGGTLPNDVDGAAVPCDSNVIAGNRIEGHRDGIVILALPGATCRNNVIRENTIVVGTPSFDRAEPSGSYFRGDDLAPPIITGMPVSLYGLANPDGPSGAVGGSIIEGNRVIGAHGVGIELVRASGNRVANNVVTDIRRRDPFPGNVVTTPAGWADANGSGIWVSPGSAENEIVGNTFGNTAAHAIVLEGDRNRVETCSTRDAVRDVGSGNQVAPHTPCPAAAAAELGGSDTVHVAPPTGEREADRASILAALEQARPGTTLQFAPGTYLVGQIIAVPNPRITLQGHPEQTTLRGCEPAEYEAMEAAAGVASGLPELWAAVSRCGMFELTGGHVTVRDLTFEYGRMGLILGESFFGRSEHPDFEGGYLIEGNTFRNTGNGVRPGLWATAPTVIRANTFTNAFHAVSGGGSHIHVLDNVISMPEPGRVPGYGHPGFAIGIGAPPRGMVADPEGITGRCDHNVIAGNRVDGYPDGIFIAASPGTTCRNNVIRDNTLGVARAVVPASRHYPQFPVIHDESDSTVVGVPLAVIGLAAADEAGTVADNLIEGNRIHGAEGVGLEVVRGSRNRIVNNTIRGIRVRAPFPGNSVGFPVEWRDANGAGIWISPGSDENEILGNVFEDIAAHAVFLEGDRNRVETRGPSDLVRDLGHDNRVTAPVYDSRFADARGIRLHYLDFGGSGLPLIFIHDWYEDAHTWATMAPPYADAYRVLAMTRRGYGESDDVGWGYDVATQSEDILGFMDALGIERAVLVGRHPTTQDMTWIAEHHPERLAGLVYLYHAVWPSPGDARMLRDRTFAEMFTRYGGCWMGGEAYVRGAPRLLYRPHYADDERRRIDVPALSFTHAQDAAAGAGEFDLLDVTLAGATSADPGGGVCDAAGIAAPVAWLTALSNDPERLAAVRALVPTGEERRRYAEAFERAFGSHLRIVRLEDPAASDYRSVPEAFQPHIRGFLEAVSAREQRGSAAVRR